MDHKVSRFQKAKTFHAHVPCDLRNPALVRMRRDSCDMNLPTADPNEKMHIKSDESVKGPHLGGEEICPKQKISVSSNELFPGRCLFPLGSRSQPISLQNISHRVIADPVSEINQGPNDSV